ncbi:MAG: WhiB family transcriptional regulator [Acidimicrobiales bacterium]
MALAEYDLYAGLLVGLDPPNGAGLRSLFPPRPAWMAKAACRGPLPPGAAFFPAKGQKPAGAKAVCARCPVTAECLAYAMADVELVGTWGGTTAAERRALRAALPPTEDPEVVEGPAHGDGCCCAACDAAALAYGRAVLGRRL